MAEKIVEKGPVRKCMKIKESLRVGENYRRQSRGHMSSIRNPTFALFVGQGVKLGSAFGVVRKIRGDEALVFFADGERTVPVGELERPSFHGDYQSDADADLDGDVVEEAVPDPLAEAAIEIQYPKEEAVEELDCAAA
jgi:hypothetical protein